MIRGGNDDEALKLLFLHYHRKLRGLAWNITKSVEETDDVCQEALTKFWQEIKAGRLRSLTRNSLARWLFVTTRNLAFSKLRQRPPSSTSSIDDIAEDHQPTNRDHLRNPAIAELKFLQQRVELHFNPKLAVVFRLIMIHGHSIRDVAQILHIPQGTVKSRLFKITSALRAPDPIQPQKRILRKKRTLRGATAPRRT